MFTQVDFFSSEEEWGRLPQLLLAECHPLQRKPVWPAVSVPQHQVPHLMLQDVNQLTQVVEMLQLDEAGAQRVV